MNLLKHVKGKGASAKQEISDEDIQKSQEELLKLTDNLMCIICDEVHTLTGKEIFRQFK